MSRRKGIYQNQSGLVSIMVTMVMLLVISLTVLTFAKIIRREQRQTLDRQLSTQALYAAESGVHVAVQALRDANTSGTLRNALRDKTTCAPTNDATFNTKLQLDTGIEVSCLMTDATPTKLEYKNVAGDTKVIPIISANGGQIDTITLSWKDAGGSTTAANGTNCPNNTNLPATSAWACPVGILRFDLVPTNGPVSRQGLTEAMFTVFAKPTNTGSSAIVYQGGAANIPNQGQIFPTTCSGSPAICTLTIDTDAVNASSFHMRVRTVYGSSTLELTASNNTTGVLALEGGQVVIDATGRAQDVVRRIQVRVNLNTVSSLDLPEYAIQATDGLCKRLAINSDGTVTADGSASNLSDANNICSKQ